MKIKLYLVSFMLAGFVSARASEANNNVWVAISPNLTTNQLHSFCESEMQWLLKAPAKTHVRFIDAVGLETFADITIPEVQNPKGRVKELQADVQKLVNWVKSAANDHADGSANVDLPGVLKAISPDVTARTSIIIAGSPLYLSDEKGFAFFAPGEPNSDARFRRPAHCHLFATPDVSPFGTKGRNTELGSGDAEIFWLIPDETKLGPTLYRQGLEEFWALYAQMVGGALVSWTSDTDRTLKRVLERDLTPIAGTVHQNENQFEMLSVARATGSERIIVNEPTPITMGDTGNKPITDFIIVDRTGSMGNYIGTVASKILQMPKKPQKRYALIFFDDHDVRPVPAVLASEGKTLEEIAHTVAVEPLYSSKDLPEALEDAVGLAEDIIHKRSLKNVNLYIFTDASSKTDCPLGYDYPSIAKQLMAEGHEIYLADLHVHIFNQLPGTHIY